MREVKRSSVGGALLLQSRNVAWRIESIDTRHFLVVYQRYKNLFMPFHYTKIKLPTTSVDVMYTGLAMAPKGVMFVVDNLGGILHVAVTNPRATPKSITPPDMDAGNRSVVFDAVSGFVIVGNGRDGALTRVDVKNGARRHISVVPHPLPAGAAQRPLGLVLLGDRRLTVLSAAHLHVLQDDGGHDAPWSRVRVIGVLPIGGGDASDEEALFCALADPKEHTIIVVSRSRKDATYCYYTIALPQDDSF